MAIGWIEGLRPLRKVRTDAWNRNVKFSGYGSEGRKDGGTIREAAAKEGIFTLEDYLDVTMDEDLN
ncbi:hypothetical protein [Corynebacterium argentoratense]|uniref:hypothetical protein n=1 Tax=Corynebacterium argentoratense TaxID=42817 RepID=UPI001F2FD642|nr:hypothetical protein [Corynebacterium argentoratense]MCF1711250.1 hypothetical protein [Corynebacterium argentoratense]